jgi:hypothetical protein
MKSTRIALGIVIFTSFSHYCSAYTWNVINLTGQSANIKIKPACVGEGPWSNVPPSPDLKHPVRVPLKAQEGCCIAGVQVDGKDVDLKAITNDQLAKLMYISPLLSTGGATAGATAGTVAGFTAGAVAAPIATVATPIAAAVPPIAIGAALLLAGAGAAIGIVEAFDRCKSRDLVIGTDGAYLVVEPIEGPKALARRALSGAQQLLGKIK